MAPLFEDDNLLPEDGEEGVLVEVVVIEEFGNGYVSGRPLTFEEIEQMYGADGDGDEDDEEGEEHFDIDPDDEEPDEIISIAIVRLVTALPDGTIIGRCVDRYPANGGMMFVSLDWPIFPSLPQPPIFNFIDSSQLINAVMKKLAEQPGDHTLDRLPDRPGLSPYEKLPWYVWVDWRIRCLVYLVTKWWR